MTRLPFAAPLAALALALTGCQVNIGPGGGGFNVGGSKQATEERTLSAPHVAGSALDVTTGLGSVDVAADPTLTEVKITAKVTASGATEEEAKERLADIRVDVVRRDDRTLAIAAVPKKEGAPMHGGCSFVVRVPDLAGAKAKSGNGSVTLAGVGGPVDARSGLGAVTVKDALGAVDAESGNGSVTVTGAGGRVTVKSGLGAVTVRDAAGDVDARSGNGSVTVAGAKGTVKARSSLGKVSVERAAGPVDAESDSGPVSLSAAPGGATPFHVKSSIGSVSVTLPAGATGRVKADTTLGTVTLNGQPKSVTGDRKSKTIVLSDGGPESTAHSGNGSVTVTLE